MRILSFILALLLGFLVAMIVEFWPRKPVWSMFLPSNVQLMRYQPVNKKLIGVAYPTEKTNSNHNQRVLVWDALSGQFLQEFELFFDTPPRTVIQIAPDLRSALVSDVFQKVEEGVRKEIRGWSIYDLTTGHQRFGPQLDSFLNARPWSADGRWFYSSTIKPGNKQFLSIHSLATGEVVHEFQPPEGYHSGIPTFSPDGSSVCLFWQFVGNDGKTRVDGKELIAIHELPTGKELVRIACPKDHLWSGTRAWNGESLIMVEGKMESKRFITECFVVYPFQPNPIESEQLDPVLSKLEDARQHEEGEYDLGATWIAEKGAVRPEKILGNWFVRVRDWLMNKMQVDITTHRYFVSCYTRPEGVLRFELTGLTSPPTHVVNDGRLLLTSKRETGKDPWTLEAWDLDPPPRWPWSVASGIATAGLILLLASWRAKRKQRILTRTSWT